MHPIETQVLTAVQQDMFVPQIDQDKLLSLPLGAFSEEFRLSPLLENYCKKMHCGALKIRLAIEKYFISRKKEDIHSIEKLLLSLPSPLGHTDHKVLQNKNAGTYLLPVSVDLVRQVYLSGDLVLIELFKKHFPIPPSAIFDLVPELITSREQSALKIINELNFKKEESAIIKLQRKIRMQNRQREELARITILEEEHQANFLFLHSMEVEATYKFQQDLMAEVLKNPHEFSLEASVSKRESQESIYQRYQEYLQLKALTIIRDANTPYTPKCEPKLAERIMKCARSISAFSTIKHITSEKALVSLLDDAMYGRRNLLDLYLPFNPASLKLCDLVNGDGNVVCFGTQDIDPLADGEIIITFDLSKTIATNPAAFYKQRDLGFVLRRDRYVKLGDERICFDHTLEIKFRNYSMTYMLLETDGKENVCGVDKNIFIIKNLEQIHEILTLNFFRFIDAFDDKESSKQLYNKINKLTDDELFIFLTDIEKNFTDTAEFNFYGAHKIDFSCITDIVKKDINYQLNLSEFIETLNQGNINELRISRLKISKLFQSYRFLDYLLSKISHPQVLYYLWDLRRQCITPGWEPCPDAPIQKFDIDWSLKSDDTAVIISENMESQIPSLSVESERELDLIPENDLTDSLCNDFIDVNAHEFLHSESSKGTELFCTNSLQTMPPFVQQTSKSTSSFNETPSLNEERNDAPEINNAAQGHLHTPVATLETLDEPENTINTVPQLEFCEDETFPQAIHKAETKSTNINLQGLEPNQEFRQTMSNDVKLSPGRKPFTQEPPFYSPLNLQILGGFAAVLGITAVAIAFILINAGTMGVALGLSVAVAATVVTAGGLGLFALGTNKPLAGVSIKKGHDPQFPLTINTK